VAWFHGINFPLCQIFSVALIGIARSWLRSSE
jgi:hypothetical protein